MELTQLRYFQAVAKYEHITQAAAELYTSQSSLSKTISRLEHELGQPLFDRVGNHVRLNAAGRQFYQAVNLILQTLDDSVAELKQTTGSISVAASMPGILPDLMERFRGGNPNAPILQRLMSAEEMLREITRCELDFAVSHQPLIHDSVDWRPLYRDEIIALISKAHPLANRGAVSLATLAQEQFVSNNAGFGIQQLFNRLCAQAGFLPNITLECNEPELLYKIVASNQAVMLTPALPYLWKSLVTQPDPPFQFITALRITDPDPSVEIGVGTLKGRKLLPTAQSFYQLVVSSFTNLQGVRDSGKPISRRDLMQAIAFVNPLEPQAPAPRGVMTSKEWFHAETRL